MRKIDVRSPFLCFRIAPGIIRLSVILSIFSLMVSAPAAFSGGIFRTGDFKKAVQFVSRKVSTGKETGASWQLDFNGYAAKVRDALLIFDYANDRPVNKEGRDLERSLFTGVIDPEELAEETLVVFYSHKHPAEKTFLKTLEWRKEIKKIYYVVTQEVYDLYEDRIEEIREEESSALRLGSVYQDLADQVKIAKPGEVIAVAGVNIKVVEHEDLLDPGKKRPYPGVEFIVETGDGVTVYHSGAFTCYACLKDLPSVARKSERALGGPVAVSSSTKSMTFSGGKLVSVDGEQIGPDAAKDERDRRMAFAMYAGTDPDDIVTLVGCSKYFEEGGPITYPVWRLFLSDKARPPSDMKFFESQGLAWWQLSARGYRDLKGNRKIIETIAALAAKAIRHQEWLAGEREMVSCRLFDSCWTSDETKARLRGGLFYLSGTNPYVYFGYVDHWAIPFGFDPREGVYSE